MAELQQDDSPLSPPSKGRSPASSIVLLLVGLFLGWLVGGGGRNVLEYLGSETAEPRENFVTSVHESVTELDEYEPLPLPEVTLRMQAPEAVAPPLRAEPLPQNGPLQRETSPPPTQPPKAPPPPAPGPQLAKPPAAARPTAAKASYPAAQRPPAQNPPSSAKKPAPQLRIPEPGYPVFQAERLPSPSQHRQEKQSPNRQADMEYVEAEPDDLAYPTYSPQVFIRGQTGVPYALVEFELSKDGSFYVSIIEGTGVERYDDIIIDTLRDWKWQPAIRNGSPIDSVERIRLRSVTLPLEEWERQRRQAGRAH